MPQPKMNPQRARRIVYAWIAGLLAEATLENADPMVVEQYNKIVAEIHAKSQ